MKSLMKRIAQTAAVVALLAPASTVMAGNQVPLKGDITIVPDGSPSVVISTDPLIVRQSRSITGIVSHLGRVEGTIVQNVNLQNLNFFGVFTLYGANGDSITGEVTGNLVFTEDPTILDVIEAINITGGTGRFAGATGSAIGDGQANRATGVALESFRGVISSPGSLR
jgi:hypothetical protein